MLYINRYTRIHSSTFVPTFYLEISFVQVNATYRVIILTAEVIQYVVKHMQIGSLYLDF